MDGFGQSRDLTLLARPHLEHLGQERAAGEAMCHLPAPVPPVLVRGAEKLQ